jgi:hypothetical protein
VWARLLTNKETTCRVISSSNAVFLRARVTNISHTGIHFVVDQPLRAETLLSVELPGPADRTWQSVLAYAVHVTPQPCGLWGVGCSFAEELTEEDLLAFGVSRSGQHARDRRASTRYLCSLTIGYSLATSSPQEERLAEVVDVSRRGLCLVVNHLVEVGTLLNLGLPAEEDEKAIWKMLASVVRAVGPVDGKWTLGCHFIEELTDSEFQALSSEAEASVAV